MKPLTAILTTIIILILAMNVLALGVMPAKSTWRMDGEGSITIVNTESIDMTAHIALEGDVARYIALESDRLTFGKTDSSKELTFQYAKPPEQLEGFIVVTQVPLVETGQVKPRIQLKHRVILVPTPKPASGTAAVTAQSGNTADATGEIAPATDGVIRKAGTRALQLFSSVERPEPNPPAPIEIIGALVMNIVLALGLVVAVRKWQ